MADGKVIIDIDGDTKEFESALNSLQGLASKASQVIAGAIAGIGSAFVVAGTKSLGIASNLQEVQNVVDVTFGEGAKQIDEFAKTAGEAFGLSELQAKNFTSTIGSITKSMGLTEEKTLETSKALTGLIGDLASFKNLSIEESFDKIRSGLVGESEPLLAIGVDVRVEALEEYASKLGLVYSELDSTEKLELRIKAIMAGNADAMGDYTRTRDGYANTLRTTNVQLQELGVTFGSYLLPIATESLGGIQTAIKTLGNELKDPKIEQAIKTIGDGFSTAVQSITDFVVKSIPEILQGFALLIENIDTVMIAIGALAGAMISLKTYFVLTSAIASFKALGGAVGIVTTAFNVLKVAMLTNPIGIVVVAIGALVGAFITAYQASDEFRKMINDIWADLSKSTITFLRGFSEFFKGNLGFLDWATSNNDELAVLLDNIDRAEGKLAGANFDNNTSMESSKKKMEELSDEAKKLQDEINNVGKGKEGETQENPQLTELQLQLEQARLEIELLQNELANIPHVPDINNVQTSSGVSIKGQPQSDFVGAIIPPEILAERNEEALKTGDKLADDVVTGFEGADIGSSIGDALRNAIDGQYESVGDMFKDMGMNLMSSLADSMISNGVSYLNEAISIVGGLLVDGFNAFLGIQSPSKVFAQMGVYNMQGLANGMTDSVSYVDKSISAVSRSISGLTPSFDYSGLQSQAMNMPQMALAGSSQMGYTPNIIINNTSEVPNTEIQTTQSVNSNGDVQIETIVVSTVVQNVAQGGSIMRAINASQSKGLGR